MVARRLRGPLAEINVQEMKSTNASIISNSDKSHKEVILNLLTTADEIVFAIGFFKESGFRNIENILKVFVQDETKQSTFLVGTGYGETSPKALKNLLKVIKGNSSHRLILCSPNAGIFHPKIYIFRKGEKVTIIIGSANLTEAGWSVNDEISLRIETTINSNEFKELRNYIDSLISKYRVNDIEELIVKYSNELDKFKKSVSSRERFRFRIEHEDLDGVDIKRLEMYYTLYRKSSEFIDPQEREQKYHEAKRNLTEIANDKELSRKEFHDLFGPLVGHSGYRKLWHSGSIHRKTHSTLDYIPAFRELIRLITRNIELPIDQVYDQAMNYLGEQRKKDNISGIGQNIIAEIMMSLNFQKFANINKNPIFVLTSLGRKFKSIQSFSGKDYEEYITVLSKIKKHLKMDSFLEIDSFFNYVYWNLQEE